MKIDFDTLRISIGGCYNDLAETKLSSDQQDILLVMRGLIGGLLACHDPDHPEINAIHDQIELREMP